MRFLLLKDLIHPLKNLPSRFRGPHPTFEPFLFNFKMAELEPPKSLLLMRVSVSPESRLVQLCCRIWTASVSSRELELCAVSFELRVA